MLAPASNQLALISKVKNQPEKTECSLMNFRGARVRCLTNVSQIPVVGPTMAIRRTLAQLRFRGPGDGGNEVVTTTPHRLLIG